ncbi:hypothetical protein [Geopsychrobacter electrodiphilus]|uniref:hypothetical protein n=1 Tax=Geopsychrobacter electrodiphilus TaxID=225196 RepID=UPI00037B16A6|nr:hypothetical protein [Geopsychrobacter electrodiphilus]
MKLLVIPFLLLVFGGCTTMVPVELAPKQLHDKITTSDIVKVGQSVKIVVTDGSHHEFRVTEITDSHISGKDVAILIADIVALETSEFSGGKTALLAGTVIMTPVLILTIMLISMGGVLAL